MRPREDDLRILYFLNFSSASRLIADAFYKLMSFNANARQKYNTKTPPINNIYENGVGIC